MRVASLIAVLALMAGPAGAQSAGTTSGPASGSSATLGTSGQSTATPHMKHALKKGGGTAMRDENKGAGAGTMPQKGASDAGAGSHSANDE